MRQKLEGWVSEEEYDRWTAEIAEQDRQTLLRYQQQMREQRPGLFLSWKQLLKAFIVLAGLVALPWIVVYVVAAWFRLW